MWLINVIFQEIVLKAGLKTRSFSCQSYKMQFFTKCAMSNVWKIFQSHATDYLGVIPEAYLEPSRTIWSNIYDGAFLQKYLAPKIH